MLPILKAVAQADSVFYMANGSYSPSIYNLDIDMPAECTATADGVAGGGQVWKCGKDILIDNSGGYYARGFYCPGHNDRYHNCTSYYDFNITMEVNEGKILPPTCYAPERSDFGQKICASFGF